MGLDLTLSDVLCGLIGLSFGSFATVVASRLPQGQPFTGRSRCPACHAQLKPGELVPVLSYVVQRGACKHCGARISPAYPALEIASGLIFPIFWRSFGPGTAALLNMAVAFHLIAIAGTDWLYNIIPNKLLISMSAFAILLKVTSGMRSVLEGLAGAALGFLFLYAVALIRPGGMGGGDVKMTGAIGLYLGVWKVFPALALAFILGTAWALPLLITGRKKRTDYMPLGIFLSASTVIMAIARS
ncbi:MAG TPA: prepilin peptidase [Firmicutes bacterium]|nr:prepilin peptidase [Bacillota bacterium]